MAVFIGLALKPNAERYSSFMATEIFAQFSILDHTIAVSRDMLQRFLRPRVS